MSQPEIEQLSERELELLQPLSEGLSNREIAQMLHISPNTVKVHLRKIYTKLNVRSRAEATRVAIEKGLVKLNTSQVDVRLTGNRVGTTADQLAQDSSPETIDVPQAVTIPPLARWKRIYLIAAALLVAIGLWVTWPRFIVPHPDQAAETSTPVTGVLDQRWTSLTTAPTPRTRLAAVFHDKKIFVIGGRTTGGTVSDAVEIYDPDQDLWTNGAPKIVAVADAGAVALHGKIFVPGGRLADGTMSSQLEVYEPDNGPSGTWSMAQDMHDARCAYAITAYEGELYLFGGWDGTAHLATSYVYNARLNQWHKLAPMPTARAYAAAGTIGQQIYVVGGESDQAALSTCEVYDPDTDSWDTCPSMSRPRSGIGAAVVDNKLYVVGGKRSESDLVLANEFLGLSGSDPSTGEWKPFSSPQLQEWLYPGITSSDTTLYAIGGGEQKTMDDVRAYSVIFRVYLPGVSGN